MDTITISDIEIGQIHTFKANMKKDEIFTCSICYEDFDMEEVNAKKVEIKMLNKCNHMFCSDCFKEAFRAQIEDLNMSHHIKCP